MFSLIDKYIKYKYKRKAVVDCAISIGKIIVILLSKLEFSLLFNLLMRITITCLFFLFCFQAQSQDTSKIFIKLIQPFKENNIVKSPKQNIIGSTCKSCSIAINQQ